ncbi:SynChlorMet cassette protein ScmD [Methanofollis aquaemaris]|uniref:SynChlorMet cassette protein ScmD n=1 Tax=Methanofollis aquaemaris TaxID=126734 RepID=A0A8A3S4Z0_9EURY|nr:SynChlorMet cassette protein ScmD [Methanofollis aquaemaris]QSZ66684.1 SynChlorMet cassette protein ScmD [Methanofollis aquaemaris]
MTNADIKPVQNPQIIFREEFDDWAILFDPDTGEAYGLNPTGAWVWKLLDGKNSIEEICESIRGAFSDVPAGSPAEITTFIDELVEKGFAGQDVTPHGTG